MATSTLSLSKQRPLRDEVPDVPLSVVGSENPGLAGGKELSTGLFEVRMTLQFTR